ncbi:tRNA lysidine(34) synthetase TilS [Micrococcus terreus]|uniref:tRNA lysidine(34) synthetase TilS n=1 Tax=Micrococcus terreus TaxID=574650 RepID=UPI003D716C6B
MQRAVRAVQEMIRGQWSVLVGLSGGADSLALAVALAEVRRLEENARSGGCALPPGDMPPPLHAGALVVDHGLHPDSAQVAQRAAACARRLGFEDVQVRRVQVPVGREPGAEAGPEAAARRVRHEVFDQAVVESGAGALLLAHTRDDQAEQVLLGLARGSGTRSLAGIPERRGAVLRPLLELTRQDTEQICRWAGLQWWEDPANADPAYLRSRVRTQILPALEDPETGLSPGLRGALARTAQIAAEDAEALDLWAEDELARLTLPGGTPGELEGEGAGRRREGVTLDSLALDLEGLAALPTAVRLRVLLSAARACGARDLTRERAQAVDRLVAARSQGGGSAGPVQLPGGVVAHRERAAGYARLVLYAPGSATERAPS